MSRRGGLSPTSAASLVCALALTGAGPAAASGAFFDRYLKHQAGARLRMTRAGNVPGIDALSVGR